MTTQQVRLAGLVGIGSATLALVLGCPPSPCDDNDPNAPLLYYERVVGVNENQIVFEQLGYERSCGNIPYEVPQLHTPAEGRWVRVDTSDLRRENVFRPPLAGAYSYGLPAFSPVFTDGHWAAYPASYAPSDGFLAKNLDTGDILAIPPAQAEQTPSGFSRIEWPYVLAQDTLGPYTHDFSSGVSKRIPGATRGTHAVLANGVVLYDQTLEANGTASPTHQLKLWDIAAEKETVLAQDRPGDIENLWLLPSRAVWSEMGARDRVYVYDRNTAAVSSVICIQNTSTQRVSDVGEAGILTTRRDNVDGDINLTLDLVTYDGQRGNIDIYPEANSSHSYGIQFAGRYVVYSRDPAWVVFDTTDGSSREIQPFAEQLPD